MQLSDKQIQEFKDIFEKKSGKEVSWEDASEGAHNLIGFFELLHKGWLKEEKRKRKLKEFPKGFHLEGKGYTCFICGNSISDEETWYDKYGIKCHICQKAVDRKIIPASVAKNKDSWYSPYDLNDRFGIDRHGMRRWIKKGLLNARIVPNETGRLYKYLFLIKDNKEMLPPKKLTESHLVKNEEGYCHLEPWFRFVDPFEHLKGYKIMEHLEVVKNEDEKKK
ncbi:hypothetical protein KJ603_00545 [Patescibacteria group bacterium]|nr:hypothetical protein [Patescibacteria group bacterium]